MKDPRNLKDPIERPMETQASDWKTLVFESNRQDQHNEMHPQYLIHQPSFEARPVENGFSRMLSSCWSPPFLFEVLLPHQVVVFMYIFLDFFWASVPP